MLHVVQVVMWGVAETPQLFLDEGKARSAYVDCTRKCWPQRYAAYCEHHTAPAGSFASAQAFVQTIDVSEKSTVNYWAVAPEEGGTGAAQPGCVSGADEFRMVAAGIGTVKEGLALLMTDLAELAERCLPKELAPAEAQTGNIPGTLAPSASTTVEEETEAAPETYTTPDWKNFVAMIQSSCRCSKNQSTLLPRDDWRQDVYSHRTSLEYWDWVADRVRSYREKAQNAGYAVSEEPQSGYRFADPEGNVSDASYDSEWDAWCAAGLSLKASGSAA